MFAQLGVKFRPTDYSIMWFEYPLVTEQCIIFKTIDKKTVRPNAAKNSEYYLQNASP